MNYEAKATRSEKIVAGGGEMGALIRSLDWSQSLLGSIENWPQSLRTAVSICLNSRFPMVIWWGKELVLLYNDAWRPILGAKHPQALGKTGREVWGEIWEIIGAQLKSVLENAQATWSDDFLLPVERFGYTEEAYFTYSYSPIYLETGEVGGAFTAVTETTQRVIGERRLSTLRELAAHSAEARTVEEACRLVTESLSTNNADIPFALLYLLEDEKQQARLVGTSGIEAGTPASPQQVNLSVGTDGWHLASVEATGQAQLLEDLPKRFDRLPGGDWDESPYTALVMPIAQAGKQELVGFLVLAVSPRRAFDDEYRGFFELVSGSVTTAIANARTYEEERQRVEALAELDRAKTVFFSNVSHEFRTPLTLMLSPLEEMLAVAGDVPLATQRQQLEMVHRNGLRLQKLVNTLLDFSRIEAGRIQVVYEPTDLATLTGELASVFRSTIEGAGMRLQVDCPLLPSPVYIERQMWEKIVLNLLSNAFKFTFEGEITVSLRLAVGEREKVKEEGERDIQNHSIPHSPFPISPSVELVVKDTGIGIPDEELPHVFERFHQVKGAQGRTIEGSGIGLSLVQELVHLHGGTIGVTSTVGQGSCFTVSIPTGSAHLPQDRIDATRTLASTALGAESYLEEASRWQPAVTSEQLPVNREKESKDKLATPYTPSSPRIILADDNADMREYVKHLLSQNYEVETVGSGIAALAAVRQNPPDLVLTDVMMPGLDGLGLLRELRADPNTRSIPIILLSARAGEESRVEGLEAGADDYLIKPFSARELLARVEANLKMARLRQEVARSERERRLEVEAVKDNLQVILSSISDIFVTLDRNWRYTYLNDQAVKLPGMQPEDVIGRSIWEVFPDTVNSHFYTELHRAVAEQTSVQFEFYYPEWDRWFENRVYPSVNGVSIFTTDITERKRLQQEAQQTLITLQTLIEASPLAIVVIEPDTTTVQLWNPAAERLFGWSETEVLGKPIPIIPEEKVEACRQYRKTVAEGATFSGVETYQRRRDRSNVPVSISAAPLDDESDSVNAIMLIFEDISERQQAQEALRQANNELEERAIELEESNEELYTTLEELQVAEEELRQQNEELAIARESVEMEGWRYQDLFNFAPDGYVVTDMQGKIQEANQAITALLGIDQNLLIGKLLTIYVSYQNREAFRMMLNQLKRQPQLQTDELSLKPPQSNPFPVAITVSAIRDANEQVVGARWLIRDITERKRAEFRLTEQTAELMRLNETLSQTTAQLQQRNQELAQFAYVVSHDLKAPLRAISTLSEWIEHDLAGQLLGETQHQMTLLRKRVHRMDALINGLLNYARVGRQAMKVEPVNVNDLLREILDSLCAPAALTITIAPGMPRLMAKRILLSQVFSNLISNAIKHHERPDGQIQIWAIDLGNAYEFVVSDDGPGIAPEHHDRIFTIFQTLKSRDEMENTGVGLAIVKKIVETEGGSIYLESDVGQGATFCFTWPK